MSRPAAPAGQLPTAVIVGAGLNGLGVSRSLHRYGIDCVGIGMPKRLPSYSTATCRVVQCDNWDESNFIDTLKSVAARFDHKLPLLITKEEAVRWVSRNREDLQDDFILRLPQSEILDLLLSKILFHELASEAGWTVPQSMVVRSMGDLEAQLHEVSYPCILKPDAKHSAFFSNAPVKAYRINNRAELIDCYRVFSQWESAAVVQPWIEGDDDRIGFCLAYYDEDSEPLGLFVGRKLRQYPIGCGNTAIAAPAPPEWVEPILNASKEIFSTLGYQGLGSVEFKMQADGTAVIIEPTVGRTNLQNEIAVLNGVDLPAIAYFDMIGQPIRQGPAAAKRFKLVNGRTHWRLLRQRRDNSRMTLRNWLSERHGPKRYMLFRLSDLAPFLRSQYDKALRIFHKLLGRDVN